MTNKLFNSPGVSFVILQDQPGRTIEAIWVYILKPLLQGQLYTIVIAMLYFNYIDKSAQYVVFLLKKKKVAESV